MPLKPGTKAPDFTLPSTSGKEITLSEHLPCILYFYPMDFTRGCTREACEFRDEFSAFSEMDIRILGISRDSIPTHEKFKKKYELPFELISDPDAGVIKQYDALMPVIGLTARVTYLINKEGMIESVYDSLLNAKKHISQMIRNLKD